MNQLRFFRRYAGLWLAGWLLLPAAAQAQSVAGGQHNILQEITDVVGLKPRFDLRATTEVQNAAAVVYNGHRYLLYNPQFVAAVNRAGRTDWAGISILAHEIGHHLNGHTLRAGGSQPADELEADEFSGFVLRKMGASLAEAQAAMAVVAEDAPTMTHPGRSNRLRSIGEGWQRANQQIAASTRTSAPSARPAMMASRPAPQTRPSAAPVSLVGRITFRDNPTEPYYVTNRLNVIRVGNDHTPEVIGRLTRSDSREFPFVLVDGQQRRLYVSDSGRIYNARGQQVGMVSDPS
ncbi:membrane-binding protein [Hymenobacter sp. BT730]|uniref:membrane-binding protein n=1 Tax=Hymenobacter sp. BT730 TaxID=3063332 RepID=UPI0026DF8935|nr:membrane-binding protein [Hymenobacter sp. BT730]